MNHRPYFIASLVTATLVTLSGVARAETPTDEDRPSSSCVTVEVNGQVALPHGCLQREMAPMLPPQEQTREPSQSSADITRLPPNQTGLFSQSALRNRMGNTLGKGATPQRPPR